MFNFGGYHKVMSRSIVIRYICLCIMLFLLFLVGLPRTGLMSDLWFWMDWSAYSFENGLGNVYNGSTDYLPLYHYALWCYGHIQGSKESIIANIHYLKLVTIIFHFVSGFFLLKWIKKESESWDNTLYTVLFYLLNFAILYNGFIWGQVDAILTCLAFLSIYLAYSKRVTWSLVLLILAINLKLQAIIFVPLVGLILLPQMVEQFSTKRLFRWLVVSLLIQVLILVPFIAAGTVDQMWKVVIRSMGKYPVVSMNAYNMWDFLLPGDLRDVQDSTTFLFMSFKHWGMLLFFSLSFVALLPLVKSVFLSIYSKAKIHISKEGVFLLAALIPLLFFFFNTQMHERYSHPAYLFLVGYSIMTRRPGVAILGCLAYFLNMEGVLKFMQLPNYKTLLFNRDFVASLHLATIGWLFYLLFKERDRLFGVIKEEKDYPM